MVVLNLHKITLKKIFMKHLILFHKMSVLPLKKSHCIQLASTMI